ncbi:MAG: DUF1425 domain-containing protein [Planctomycetes bacterium]|nr:DUF1425 domain-containing protein [Planctomycetota bacterium]
MTYCPRQIQHLVYASAVAISLAGCTTNHVGDSVAGPGRAADDALPAAAYPDVVFVDGTDGFIVRRGDPVITHGEFGHMRVRIPLRSTSSQVRTLRYKFTFVDKDGFEFNQNPLWRRISIEARTAFELVGEIVDSRAADFRCIVGTS